MTQEMYHFTCTINQPIFPVWPSTLTLFNSHLPCYPGEWRAVRQVGSELSIEAHLPRTDACLLRLCPHTACWRHSLRTPPHDLSLSLPWAGQPRTQLQHTHTNITSLNYILYCFYVRRRKNKTNKISIATIFPPKHVKSVLWERRGRLTEIPNHS